MRSAHVIPLLLLCACPAACKSERAAETRKEPSAMAPQLSGRIPRQMRNCPSGVPSAKTVATPTADGVNLTITSDNPAARRRIVALAQMHATWGEPIWAMPYHTGMHGGPGTIGLCPIIHAKTIVTQREIPEGVLIHVRSEIPGMESRLQELTKLRVNALEPPSS
ncbi:MAG TPA: hypothetical protein VFV99_14010 [Kofleriaceae bacterium]|nr:hypothetical protein [Kofleriaceae bacterium]